MFSTLQKLYDLIFGGFLSNSFAWLNYQFSDLAELIPDSNLFLAVLGDLFEYLSDAVFGSITVGEFLFGSALSIIFVLAIAKFIKGLFE